ncbi:TIGR03943 family putative permease subunit [Paludifilum halophilum]|uniref:TIGR03943 family protein n=1 Tax=Paludifilum halophilum TaxID=1642702 RepID=A0A235B3Q1_9BACL|nr:TIGR03943 family protein [Paludifilum halophilum]OYD06862.1 TIGR03943 family protein [Paludifilum halophilum]
MGSFLRIVICFGTAVMLIHMLITGELRLFINPRFTPLIIFSTLLLILFGLVQIWHLKQPAPHRIGGWGYILLCFPILAFILVPPAPLNSSMASKKGINYLSPEAMESQQVLTKEEKERRTGERGSNDPSPEDNSELNDEELLSKPPSNEESYDPNPYYNKIVKKLKAAAVIELDDKNYIDRLTTLQMYDKELKGKPVKVKGFIFRADNMPEGVVLVSRYSITCCTADASVIGIFAKFPGSDQIKEGTWIEVKGGLDSIVVERSRVPFIEAPSHRVVEAPKDPYVYANY